MHQPSPAVLGATIVDGFGGKDRLLARARRAMDERQYALAAKLAGYAVAAAPEDGAARTAKAAALRKLAQVSWGTQGYNFYLTEALHLEGNIDMHKSPAAATRSYSGVAAAPTAALVSVLESRIDPDRSRDVEKALAIRFRDTGEAFTVAVRRGVAETRPGAAADAALRLETDRRSWFDLIRRVAPAEELARQGRISAQAGDIVSLAAFLDLFDAD